MLIGKWRYFQPLLHSHLSSHHPIFDPDGEDGSFYYHMDSPLILALLAFADWDVDSWDILVGLVYNPILDFPESRMLRPRTSWRKTLDCPTNGSLSPQAWVATVRTPYT